MELTSIRVCSALPFILSAADHLIQAAQHLRNAGLPEIADQFMDRAEALREVARPLSPHNIPSLALLDSRVAGALNLGNEIGHMRRDDPTGRN
ncbi:hypothetical protein DdX_16821 [Ditylenchus destructor]|uniref:Uncharacterized protein n=1 Tax=Ditylenchus destructor TaxID=166010 RepID=A0AAD4QTT1_9BILA|nr:hypothetical protein DdX_16821 [Ditylenchus destructor]